MSDKTERPSGEQLAMDLLEALAYQTARVDDLKKLAGIQQDLIESLSKRVEEVENHYQSLIMILERSTVKIDERKLGLN